MDWKPGRPQSPTPLPVKDQVPCANSSVKLLGGVKPVKGTQVWTHVGRAAGPCNWETGSAVSEQAKYK